MLVKLLNPAIFEYLWRSGDSIKRFILADFEERKDALRKEMQLAKSKIHISFDLWTSPNKLAMIGVVAHYLTKELVAISLLISLRELVGAHTDENIGAWVLLVIEDMFNVGQMGYFISDNDSANDLAVEAICRELKLPNPATRRLRCIGHVLNLSAKGFLFGKDEGSFDFEIAEMAKLKIEVRQALELAGKQN
jgi:hypothetical protein